MNQKANTEARTPSTVLFFVLAVVAWLPVCFPDFALPLVGLGLALGLWVAFRLLAVMRVGVNANKKGLK